MTRPDSELIARVVISDDHAAFRELVIRHQSAVRQFLRHLARGNATLADDLAQETFVHAYRNLHRFRGDSSFTTWLLGIAHNHWRNARRQQRDDVQFETLRTPEAAVPATASQSDLQHDLAAALHELSPDEQTALHLCYQQGLSHSEISALLDWPLGTVKTHLARSKEKLRQLLAVWNPTT